MSAGLTLTQLGLQQCEQPCGMESIYKKGKVKESRTTASVPR